MDLFSLAQRFTFRQKCFKVEKNFCAIFQNQVPTGATAPIYINHWRSKLCTFHKQTKIVKEKNSSKIEKWNGFSHLPHCNVFRVRNSDTPESMWFEINRKYFFHTNSDWPVMLYQPQTMLITHIYRDKINDKNC